MIRRRRGFSPFRLATRVVLILAVLWLAGLVWYASEIARAQPKIGSLGEVPSADAVVVLTGTPDRLDVGFELLAASRAQRMFISGVYRGVDVQQILKALRRSPDEAENAVVLGYGADDTIGNARETAVWMAKEGLTSLILVTSNFHMPRALMEFRAAMPGVTIVPHATAVASFKIDDWWRWPGTIRLIASEWSKYILARARIALGIRVATMPMVSPAPVTPPRPAQPNTVAPSPAKPVPPPAKPAPAIPPDAPTTTVPETIPPETSEPNEEAPAMPRPPAPSAAPSSSAPAPGTAAPPPPQVAPATPAPDNSDDSPDETPAPDALPESAP
jgi:uncharacterized SAM-binding protein YcdF (DUF218 family)